jgi:phospholipid transport system substrate-binding protein
MVGLSSLTQLYRITWTVGGIDGVAKIVDITIEGASLRITQRDDCASFLARNNQNIDALIERMRRQADVTT